MDSTSTADDGIDLKTPHILILDGKASLHDWRMMAVAAAVDSLVQGPNWSSDTKQPILDTLDRKKSLSDFLNRHGDVTVEGRTARIYPLTMPPDHWAGEERQDYRGNWGKNGGGVEIVGLIIDEPEDGDEWTAKLAALGYEHYCTNEVEPDTDDVGPDLSAWRPLPPDGDGWVLFSAFQSEDGDLLAQWIRPAVRPDAADA